MEEIWKDIKKYEGLYQISNLGRVKTLEKLNGLFLKKEKILKLGKSNKGYCIVSLCKNSQYKTFNVHRLVAEAFIPNPLNLPCVNHKDYNICNNRIENLEWVTYKVNSQWSIENNRKGQLKKNKPLSGHHYIQKRGANSYRFQFNKNNKCITRKSFKKLEDAIKYRDEWLAVNYPQITI